MKLKASTFTGVFKISKHSSRAKPWRMQFDYNDAGCSKTYETEREAAIAYDLLRIKHNLEPVNILKRCIQ